MKAIRAIALTFLIACTYLYLQHKYSTLSVPKADVIAYCTGNQSPEAVCECFNYYGRKCMSGQRLVWDLFTEEEE